MVEYVTITWSTSKKRCVICNSPMSKIFPEDFPDEWKMCCWCRDFGVALIANKKDMILEYYSNNHYRDVLYLDKKLDKILKMITLVG